MTTRISMNRKNIKEDKIRILAKEHGFAEMLLDDKTLLESRQSLVPDNRNPNKDIWVFGYGSLIWNPIVEISEKRIAKAYGYHRKFCLKTEIGRGNKHEPGLVLGLNNGGSTSGIALKINNKLASSELDLIWRREMITGAYKPKNIIGYTNKGKIQMIAFVINKKHDNYLCSITEAETAKMIYKAHGFLGSCREYLDKTCESLNELEINDTYLKRLQRRIFNKKFS